MNCEWSQQYSLHHKTRPCRSNATQIVLTLHRLGHRLVDTPMCMRHAMYYDRRNGYGFREIEAA